MQRIGRRPLLAAVFAAGLIVTANLATPPDPAPDAADASEPPQPSFTVRWQNNALVLAGHTFSTDHEEILRRRATRLYPDATLLTNFEPLGIVPDYWPAFTATIPAVLGDAQSGEATLYSGVLKINAVSETPSNIAQQIDKLAAALPTGLTIQSNIIPVDRAFSVRDACEQASQAVSIGAIGFEENSEVLLTSSLPRLQRVAALANACTELTLRITGHTDSSGNEAWNRTLSELRAQAVSAYLRGKGVHQERLLIAGVGSSRPLASNATRFGRSINRRIEIEFLSD